MQWSTGVGEAIATSRTNNGVLVILVEPNSSVMNPKPVSKEKSQDLLSRLSTSALHSKTFKNASVLKSIKDSNSTCLKLIHDTSDPDYKSFSEFFKLDGVAPNLFFIAPSTGLVIYRKKGFVSPKQFLQSISTASKAITGVDLVVDIEGATGSSSSVPVVDTKKKDVADTSESVTKTLPTSVIKSEIQETKNSSPSSSKNEQNTGTLSSGTKSMKLSSTNSSSQTESRILARLPSGTQTRKTFSHTAKFSAIRNWLSDEVKTQPRNLIISMYFPHRVFDAAHDSKMLSELDLIPSATLNVVVVESERSSGASIGSLNTIRNSSIGGYASGAAQFIGGFFRSFVQDPAQEEDPTEQTNSGRSGNTTAGIQNNDRLRRMQDSRPSDEDNLMSNGNSTQFGWNPHDVEDEQR